MIDLNEEQRQAIIEHPDEPLRLTDSATKKSFVLLRAELFDRLKGLLYDDGEFSPSEAYPLLNEMAAKAGWNDPSINIYNDICPEVKP